MDVEIAMKKHKTQFLIVTRDLDAKIGTQNHVETAIGTFLTCFKKQEYPPLKNYNLFSLSLAFGWTQLH